MKFLQARLLILLPGVLALGQNESVTLTANPGLLQLAGKSINGQILLSADDWWGVIRAAEDLASDFGKVTGTNLTLGNWGEPKQDGKRSNNNRHHKTQTTGTETTVFYTYNPPTNDINYTAGPELNFTGPTLHSQSEVKTVIIAGTIGKSTLIQTLITSKKLNVEPIEGKWESFISEVITTPIPGIDRALVIAGSDLRGTIFGLYDISEQIGVSPWYWFADVPVGKQNGVWALEGTKVQGSPSVKYRGIFLNDEQPGLTNWINANYAPGKYGAGFNHFFYSRVFELLLRLRANYLWPVMWGNMFNVDDYANEPLADAYGIVMGTSHTEPMTRATNEWNNFGSKYGGNGEWSWDTNNVSVAQFLKYGAERAVPYVENTLFTMAMRGSHDSAIPLTQEQAISVLTSTVAAQRKILGEVYKGEGLNVTEIPQVWCLYKEVQGYYEAGMTVPEDITLLWADDNWGNLRRLPLANETMRSGGAGVYYHFDYVGGPRSYKWINTIQLEKTVEQMQLASAREANRIWIVNVGDLKPQEIPINHFLDLAYNTPQWSYDSVPTWLKLWATREFGSSLALEIASVVDRYGMYAARRKYELVDPSVYSVINYNEGDAILAQWTTLAKDAQAIYDKLDEAAKASFYQMVLQPVLGGGVVTEIHIRTAKNILYSRQKRNTANTEAQRVLDLFKTDHMLTQKYHDLLDGKWNHMLDQTHLGYDYWQQPMRNVLSPLTYVQELETSLAGSIGVAAEASYGTVSGDDNYHPDSGSPLILPPMDPYGPKTRWIEIFSRGAAVCDWKITSANDYVIATPSSGTTGGNNGTDTRVLISIDWSKAPAAPSKSTVNVKVISSCGSQWGNYPSPLVQVPVSNVAITSDFSGFIESDKHLAIEASHSSRNTTVNGISYQILPAYGRTLSGVHLLPVLADTQPAGSGPVLEYDIFTFTSTAKANITLYLSPSLNQNGPSRVLKYGIAIDTEVPQVRQFVANATGADLPKGWEGAVRDAVWGLSSGSGTTTTHDLSKTGMHTLRVWAVEPGVVIQKIVFDLGGVRASYLGPPESFRAGIDQVDVYEGTNFAGLKL